MSWLSQIISSHALLPARNFTVQISDSGLVLSASLFTRPLLHTQIVRRLESSNISVFVIHILVLLGLPCFTTR